MRCEDCPIPREVCEAGCDCPTDRREPPPTTSTYTCPNPEWRCDDCIELDRGCYSPGRQQERMRLQVKVAPRWRKLVKVK